MARISPFAVPIVLTLAVGASFALPAHQWAVGLPALACQVVWLGRYVRRQGTILVEQEQRHDRRRQLLSTLAHEVRTPLTVIRSSSTILMDEERSGALSEKQRRFVGSIYGNAQRLEALTENILAGLKIESWSDSLRLRPVDLRKEVISVARSMEPALAPREQRIHYMFPSMLPRAQADPQWIGQVLVNLIHNAGKYTDPGGTIDITVTENEHYLVLSVADNGAGLPNRRPDVFEPFVQGDPQGSASSEGTGLGLAIVKRVIALHGGEVYVASRQDGGTTVSVTLKKAGTHG
ncbi:MAG: HAMP domain-containing sensor histidine kinase [Alkalispirochaeta sp.]